MTDLSAAIPGISLDVSTAQRLVRLLDMLGSAHDGEVANAGRMADSLIRKHGLSEQESLRTILQKWKGAR
jgi:hypothetical protein